MSSHESTDRDMLPISVDTAKRAGRSRVLDLRDRRFGRLVAQKRLPEYGPDHSCLWQCLCDCGNTCTVSSNKLRTGHTKSCGCLQRERLRDSRHYQRGTCLEAIQNTRPGRNNKSGHKGVSARRSGWIAYIDYAGKRYFLGIYPSLGQAVAVRREAETLRLRHATGTEAEATESFGALIRALRKALSPIWRQPGSTCPVQERMPPNSTTSV